MAIFKNPRDTSFVKVLGRQMNGGKKNVYFEDAWNHAVARQWGYLFVDLTQQTPDDLRLRNNIFPTRNTVIYQKK